MSRVSLAVSTCVVVYKNLYRSVSVNGIEIDLKKCELLKGLSNTIDASSLMSLLNLLDKKCHICGDPDEKFVEMVKAKKGQLLGKDGINVLAKLDNTGSVTLTVQSTKCQVLIKGRKCDMCIAYRGSLSRIYNRWSKQK